MATKVKELYNGEVQAKLVTRLWCGKEIQKYEVMDNGIFIDDLLRVTDITGALPKDWMAPWVAKVNSDYLRNHIGKKLTEELIDESKKQYNIVRDTAADLGSKVHSWVEQYLKVGKKDLPDDDKVLNGITAFLKWVDAHKVKFVSSERMVYSRDDHYIGTLDAEAEVDGKLCVLDWKTSKAIYPEYFLQVGAYQKAAEQEGSVYTGDRWIARFDKETGEFECVQRGNLQEDYLTFLATLQMKRWVNRNKI